MKTAKILIDSQWHVINYSIETIDDSHAFNVSTDDDSFSFTVRYSPKNAVTNHGHFHFSAKDVNNSLGSNRKIIMEEIFNIEKNYISGRK